MGWFDLRDVSGLLESRELNQVREGQTCSSVSSAWRRGKAVALGAFPRPGEGCLFHARGPALPPAVGPVTVISWEQQGILSARSGWEVLLVLSEHAESSTKSELK